MPRAISGHVDTTLFEQVPAVPKWARKLNYEGRRGLIAMFWSSVNPYGTFRLDMYKRLELGTMQALPAPAPRRTPPT